MFDTKQANRTIVKPEIQSRHTVQRDVQQFELTCIIKWFHTLSIKNSKNMKNINFVIFYMKLNYDTKFLLGSTLWSFQLIQFSKLKIYDISMCTSSWKYSNTSNILYVIYIFFEISLTLLQVSTFMIVLTKFGTNVKIYINCKIYLIQVHMLKKS